MCAVHSFHCVCQLLAFVQKHRSHKFSLIIVSTQWDHNENAIFKIPSHLIASYHLNSVQLNEEILMQNDFLRINHIHRHSVHCLFDRKKKRFVKYFTILCFKYVNKLFVHLVCKFDMNEASNIVCLGRMRGREHKLFKSETIPSILSFLRNPC